VVRTVCSFPSNCSGACSGRACASSSAQTLPPNGETKSVMRALPCSSIITFEGFRSRCSTRRHEPPPGRRNLTRNLSRFVVGSRPIGARATKFFALTNSIERKWRRQLRHVINGQTFLWLMSSHAHFAMKARERGARRSEDDREATSARRAGPVFDLSGDKLHHAALPSRRQCDSARRA